MDPCIRQYANIKYLAWSNIKIEEMFKDAKLDLVFEDFDQFELKENIEKLQRLREALRRQREARSSEFDC